jgi:predicted DNA-binding transcriptional regulator AlpA
MVDKLLTLPEAAKMCRASDDTLRFWRYKGTGPPSARIGRRVLYRESEIVAWLDAQFAGDANPAA